MESIESDRQLRNVALGSIFLVIASVRCSAGALLQQGELPIGQLELVAEARPRRALGQQGVAVELAAAALAALGEPVQSGAE